MNTDCYYYFVETPSYYRSFFLFCDIITLFSVETEIENFHGFSSEGWWLVKPRDRDSSHSQAK